MIIFLIIALLIAVIAIVFALQNTGSVAVSFLVWHFQGSLALVLILAFIAGIVTIFFALMPSLIRYRLRASRQGKQKEILEETLSEHRQKVESLQKELEQATITEQDDSADDS